MVWLASAIKHQTLWATIRCASAGTSTAMLSQTMTFYQDEFAGRIATKLMQTALAVREW